MTRIRSLRSASLTDSKDVKYYPKHEAAFLAACRKFHTPLVSIKFREGVPVQYHPESLRSEYGSPSGHCASIGEGA